MKYILTKTTIIIACIFFTKINASAQFNSCSGSGTVTSGGSSDCAARVRIGVGTPNGLVRVCFTSVTNGGMGGSCGKDRLRFYSPDGTYQGMIEHDMAAGTCVELNEAEIDGTNDGFLDFCVTDCNGSPSTWDFTWDTMDDCGNSMCGAISGLCSGADSARNLNINNEVECGRTALFCVDSVYFSQQSSNWVHGIQMNISGDGLISSTMSGTTAPPDYTATRGAFTATYTWRYLSNPTFTSDNSGNLITTPGWYVETTNTDSGDNLGYPAMTCTNKGTFCYSVSAVDCETLGCEDNPDNTRSGTATFTSMSDSYSGSWTSNACGLEGLGVSASVTVVCPITLPLKMLNFEGKYIDNATALHWIVSEEIDVKEYEIYRSFNGIDFTKIETINLDKKTLTNGKHHYYYNDISVKRYVESYKNAFYFIKVISLTGETSAETKTINVKLDGRLEGVRIFSLHPVPSEDKINFKIWTDDAMFTLDIIDINGKLVKTLDTANIHRLYTTDVSYDIDDLTNGVYYLRVSTRNNIKFHKIIKN